MRTFKKIILSVILFLLCLSVLSVVIIEPCIQTESAYFIDGKAREELAGSIDFIYLGDSDGLSAFSPNIFDENTGCCSYNLSGSMMTGGSELFLLNTELNRNPVKTVILQIDYFSFTRDYKNERGDGNSVTLMRTDNFFERFGFLVKYVNFDEWLDVYSRLLSTGFSFWESTAMRKDIIHCNHEDKGWHKLPSVNISIPENQIKKEFNSSTFNLDFNEDIINEMFSVINLCESKNVSVYIIIQPLSDRLIWKTKNLDDFNNKVNNVFKKSNVTLIDYNLLKDRYKLFSDKESFKDDVHMSEKGAVAYTNSFSKIYSMISNGKSIDGLFYSSYEEMKKDSPYIK